MLAILRWRPLFSLILYYQMYEEEGVIGRYGWKKKTFLWFSSHSAPTCRKCFSTEPEVESWVTGDWRQIKNQTSTYEIMETVSDYWTERLFFQTVSKERFFFSIIVLEATEKCSSRLKEERETGGGIDYQYFCGMRRRFITDSKKWSLLLLNECTSLRLGERIEISQKK